MIEAIDLDVCDGCRVCIDSCPTDVLRMMERGVPWAQEPRTWKAVIVYPNDCHSCRLCAIDCHVDAIRVTHGLTIPRPFLVHEGSGMAGGPTGATAERTAGGQSTAGAAMNERSF